MLYLFVISALVSLSYIYDYRKHVKGRQTAYIFVLIVLILIAGLRYRIGLDSIRYENKYAQLPTISELFDFDFSSVREDPGYIILNAIARSISDQFIVMQFLQAAFVNIIVFWFIKKNTQNIFTAILLYFAIGSLYVNFVCEVMRESCAAACFLLGWPYFCKNQWVKYYLCATASVLFHVSGVITMVIPLLYLPRIRSFFVVKKRLILVLVFIYIIGNFISIWMFDYIQAFDLLEHLQDKAAVYADTELAQSTINYKGIIMQILTISYPIVAFCMINNDVEKSKMQKVDYAHLQFMLSICLVFIVLTFSISLFYRFKNYFYIFAIIAIANGCYQPMNVFRKRLRLSFISWLIVLVSFIILNDLSLFKAPADFAIPEIYRYYPYSSRIFPEKNQKREQVFQYHNAW